MGSPVERKLNSRFGLQQMKWIKLFNGNFEQNVESQHQHDLAIVDVTRITGLAVAILTGVEMNVHRSVMKAKKWLETY